MQQQTALNRNFWSIACCLFCLVGLTYNFAGYSLLDPDEGRNAEVAREMAESGDLVLPHLNGVPYLDKPTLYFAAGAMSIRALGTTEFAARLPSLLFTLATIALVGWFGQRLFGGKAGLVAAVATAATPFTLAYARIVIFDSALTFFVVLALVSFYLAIVGRGAGNGERGAGSRERGAESGSAVPPSRRSASGEEEGRGPTAVPPYRRTAGQGDEGKGEGWTAMAWVAMGFGVLTKGPVALVLPLLVAIPFAIRCRAWRALGDPIALLLFAVIVAPWVVAVSLRIPDFLEYALVLETFGRFSTTELNRTGPFWYFLVIFPAAALPWTLVLAGSSKLLVGRRDERGRMDQRIVFLILWVVLPLLLFSVSQSKRPQYVLPLVPAIALLVAGLWQSRPQNLGGVRVGAAGMILLGVFLIAAAQFIPNLVPASPTIAAAIPGTAYVLGPACVLSGLAAWFVRRRLELLLLAFSLPVVSIPFASKSLMIEIGNERSAQQIAQAITSVAGPSATVVGVHAFPPSLPFYLKRTMYVATADGEEITSNYIVRHLGEYRGFGSTLRRPEWWQEALLTCSRPTVFITRSDNEEARRALSLLDLVVETRKYVVFGPCGRATLARVAS